MNRHRARVVIAAMLTTLCVGACSVDPATIPLPGSASSGETYPLSLEFTDVLNLPLGAKVIADGVEVGSLTGIDVTDVSRGDGVLERGYVTAAVEIQQSVQLPEDITVELQQATPLGDVYIAISTPPHSTAPHLHPGDTVPMSQTTRAPQIEDTMAGLATALGSGMVTDFQDTIRELNATLPSDPRDTARIFDVVGTDLIAVGDDLDSLDELLTGLRETTETTVDMLPTLTPMLSEAGTEHLVATTQSVIGVILLFSDLGPVAHSAKWLAPLLSAADEAATAIVPVLFGNQPLDTRSPSNWSALMDLINNKVAPFVQRGPAVNITAIRDDAGSTDRTARVVNSLRMIGVVR